MGSQTKGTGIVAIVVGAIILAVAATGLLASITFLILGLVFSTVFPAVFGLPFQDLQLNQHALVCDGVVTGVSPNPGLTVNNHPTVRLDYEYDVAGATRSGDIAVTDVDPLASLLPGATIDVEYLPDDPAVSRILGGKRAIAGWAGVFGLGFGAFGLLFTGAQLLLLVLGVGVLWFGIRRRRAA